VALPKALFEDRKDAGRQLAAELYARNLARDIGRGAADQSGNSGHSAAIVLALPRGGVPVAAEIAAALAAPLDVVVVRKLGAPGQEELALGAVATVATPALAPGDHGSTRSAPAAVDPRTADPLAGTTTVLNEELIASLGIEMAVIERVKARELKELRRRELGYRRGLPPLVVADRSVIVVDDGVATGATMLAAITALRQARAGRITVAVPVAPSDTSRSIRAVADEFVALHVLDDLRSVGQWYVDFSQTSDDEVSALLAASTAGTRQGSGRSPGRP